MSLKDFKYSKEKNVLTKKYLVPKAVVCSKDAQNTDHLMSDGLRQPLHRDGVQNCVISKGTHMQDLMHCGASLYALPTISP